MNYKEDKRVDDLNDMDLVQQKNKEWWTTRTMSYSWGEKSQQNVNTLQWFDRIDSNFLYASRFFGYREPFDNLIPFSELKGKRVLEIGCGMGFHTELLVRSGAIVTSIDISPTSISRTQKRLDLKGLEANVIEMDASNLAFDDNLFDYVWSWGVIHHSAYTVKIIKEIHRVLATSGSTTIMVYNLNSMEAYISIVSRYLINFWRGSSIDNALWSGTDGFHSRWYTADILKDIFNGFFREVSHEVLGQEADVIPMPSYLRRFFIRFFTFNYCQKTIRKRGGFLIIKAKK